MPPNKRFNELNNSCAIAYKSCLPSASQKPLKMTKFCVFWKTRTTATNVLYFHLKLNAVITYLARASLWDQWAHQADRDNWEIWRWNINQFFTMRCHRGRRRHCSSALFCGAKGLLTRNTYGISYLAYTVDGAKGALWLGGQTPNILCYLPSEQLGKKMASGLYPWQVKKSSKLIFCGVYYLAVLVVSGGYLPRRFAAR